MTEYLIICEKSSAAKNFAKALGGQSGTYDGKSFRIVSGSGHIMELKQPHEMVREEKAAEFKSWNLAYLPWNLREFSWTKVPKKYRDARTGKVVSRATMIKDIKQAAASCQKVVIATDVDPSGEGELIGWEIIDAIGWSSTVLRMDFVDEAATSIQKAFKNMRDISDKNKDGDYVKAECRNRWDFASMQLSRMATGAARQAGFDTVVRHGRLKSVIASHIYNQLEAIKNYVRKPYFEVKFKDENGHTYARKLKADADFEGIRFDTKAEGAQDVARYNPSAITDVKKTRKTSAPGALLDLSGLASILAPKGFSADVVLATYQKMYEAQVVSYPRTEDKVITQEQFKEMVPHVKGIATLVGVDMKHLTHMSPRKTHVKDGAAHGANRPGTNVPKMMAELDQFGKGAREIYMTLAKNFLAMFGEDYVYDAVTARLADYPDFVTSFTEPVELNYKNVFDTSNETKEKDEDADVDGTGGVGQMASPYAHEGQNKKPQKPTMKWIMAYLEKHDVGTGATRTSTLAELTKGKAAMLVEKKGTYSMTEAGNLTAIMARGTWIGSVDITKQLFDYMDEVGQFKRKPEDIMNLATKIAEHDLPIMKENAKDLRTILGEPKNTRPQKEKMTGTFNGQEVTISAEWGGHKFTDAELADLFAGKTIEIEAKAKSGDIMLVKGDLAAQQFKDSKGKVHDFVGFNRLSVAFPNAAPPKEKTVKKMGGKEIKFNREWGGHRFTDEEVEKLTNGESITFDFTTSAGKSSTATGKLEEQTYNGNKFWGFKPDFGDKPKSKGAWKNPRRKKK